MGDRKTGDHAQLRAASMADDLAEFEDFQQSLLPFLRNALKKGMSADAIYKKCQAIAAARGVQIAMMETDSGKALAAVKEILDRSGGKAKERTEVTHKFKDLTDKELDAMILSESGQLANGKPQQDDEDEADPVNNLAYSLSELLVKGFQQQSIVPLSEADTPVFAGLPRG